MVPVTTNMKNCLMSFSLRLTVNLTLVEGRLTVKVRMRLTLFGAEVREVLEEAGRA